jgi:hypothetical protein
LRQHGSRKTEDDPEKRRDTSVHRVMGPRHLNPPVEVGQGVGNSYLGCSVNVFTSTPAGRYSYKPTIVKGNVGCSSVR